MERDRNVEELMSRTNKTDPFWVKSNRYGRERHEHRDGVCDIAEGNQHWDSCNKEIPWGHPMGICGCSVCGAKEWRKIESRKVRHAGKRAARDWDREY